jgi:hypothetical protein
VPPPLAKWIEIWNGTGPSYFHCRRLRKNLAKKGLGCYKKYINIYLMKNGPKVGT